MAFAQGGDESVSADTIFSSLENSLFQIRIVEKKSGSQVALGSGFLVAGNRVATNYHVVSFVVREPDKYRVEIDLHDVKQHLSVWTVDVVNDLALLTFDAMPEDLPATFQLADRVPKKGEVLYSLGNPHDLGMIIVAGNYNGLVDNKFLDRIHFSGAINSGMSGGPTVNRRSQVVGINVASAGNQVGFLVPVAALEQLLSRSDNLPADYDLLLDMARQIGNVTNAMMDALLAGEWKREEMGEAIILGEVVKWFDCWGNSDIDKETGALEIARGCNSADNIFISSRFNTGFFEYEYYYLESDNWRSPAFYREWRASTVGARPGNTATKDDVENYSCVDRILETRNPENDKTLRRRASYCVRAYKQLKGLYDVFFIGASLDQKNRAVMDHFTLSGVTQPTAERFLARFVEVLAWR
jgi:serine protease Do